MLTLIDHCHINSRLAGMNDWWPELLKYLFVTPTPTNQKITMSWSRTEDHYFQFHHLKLPTVQ